MTRHVAHVALGANGVDPERALALVLAALDAGPAGAVAARVAACARLYVGPYMDADGAPVAEAAPVWNTVAELETTLDPVALLEALRGIERDHGRVRDGGSTRQIDLDLLTYDDRVVAEAGLTLPHPRCLSRAFVLEPWAEISPCQVVPGTGATVAAHRDRLAARGAVRVEPAALAPLPGGAAPLERLPDSVALRAWRAAAPRPLGLVPTMGALHAGHLSLVRRARATCASVLVTLFVNPLQFASGDDLDRYPRTLEADVAALRKLGADAVYVPAADDLYLPGHATTIDPEGAARGYEGGARPGHFRGVATIVAKLWQRTRPDVSYFGRKDAQQVAVLAQVHRDLDFDGALVVCPTVRDLDGLALSSRNRYLDPASRRLALGLPQGLAAMARAAGGGERRVERLQAAGRAPLEAHGTRIEYLDVVDPERMQPVETLTRPALAIGVIRVGEIRLLDNRWLAPPPPGRP